MIGILSSILLPMDTKAARRSPTFNHLILEETNKRLKKIRSPWLVIQPFLEAGEKEKVLDYMKTLKLPRQKLIHERLEILLSIYGHKPKEAIIQLEQTKKDQWVKDWKAYVKAWIEVSWDFEIMKGKYFEVMTVPQDSFLAPIAMDSLKSAAQKMHRIFEIYPNDPLPVEIYPTRDRFSKASTLAPETLESSGAIGICKFKRLMILSPRGTTPGVSLVGFP